MLALWTATWNSESRSRMCGRQSKRGSISLSSTAKRRGRQGWGQWNWSTNCSWCSGATRCLFGPPSSRGSSSSSRYRCPSTCYWTTCRPTRTQRSVGCYHLLMLNLWFSIQQGNLLLELCSAWCLCCFGLTIAVFLPFPGAEVPRRCRSDGADLCNRVGKVLWPVLSKCTVAMLAEGGQFSY